VMCQRVKQSRIDTPPSASLASLAKAIPSPGGKSRTRNPKRSVKLPVSGVVL